MSASVGPTQPKALLDSFNPKPLGSEPALGICLYKYYQGTQTR